MVESGSSVRLVCATIRASISREARSLGSPVSASVATRRWPRAMLRRFASVGAVWATDSRTRLRSVWSRGASRRTSTAPIASPATTRGWQTAVPRPPHRVQAMSGSPAALSRAYARPRRMAMHERGSASLSTEASAGSTSPGAAASRRFSLGSRVSTTTWLPGSERSRCRVSSACASSTATTASRVSRNSVWLSRVAPIALTASGGTRLTAPGDEAAEPEEEDAQQQDSNGHRVRIGGWPPGFEPFSPDFGGSSGS